MHSTVRTARRILTVLIVLAIWMTCLPTVYAEPECLPGVTTEMADPGYWTARSKDPDALLAESSGIAARNAEILACEECKLKDLRKEYPSFDGEAFQRELLGNAMTRLAAYLEKGYYNSEGEVLEYADMDKVLTSIGIAETSPAQQVRYGICTALTNVRAVPSDQLITDTAGDNDFDLLQRSFLRVNEPVIILAQTAEGDWYYCDSLCVSGWMPAATIAVCADRQEWLGAWDIPDEDALVVTQGKLSLDQSNVNSGASERMLTMGTVLRRVEKDAFDPAVTNRAAYQNYPVYLPVREADGSYSTTIALIPQHYSVNEGYLPLTARNLLETAFSMLGDAYGWAGMLSVPDCSLYIRNIYKCFGLELARNTTWQSAMPVRKYDLSALNPAEKRELLDTLPVGAILFFGGHEMLYLGAEQGMHYVINTVSTTMDPEEKSPTLVRSVVVNTLENTLRRSGNTWLEELKLAMIPYMPAA